MPTAVSSEGSSDEAKNVWLWLSELKMREIEVQEIFTLNSCSGSAIDEALRNGYACGLLQRRQEPPDNPTRTYWSINPNFKEALENKRYS